MTVIPPPVKIFSGLLNLLNYNLMINLEQYDHHQQTEGIGLDEFEKYELLTLFTNFNYNQNILKISIIMICRILIVKINMKKMTIHLTFVQNKVYLMFCHIF